MDAQHKSVLGHVLRDGTLINTTLAAIIFGSLYRDPEIWLQDYPPAVREVYGKEKSPKAQRESVLSGISFLVVLIGGVLRSNRKLRQQYNGRLPFKAAFLNSFGLLLYFWLYDLVVIDWFLLMTLRPSFAILPGTEGMHEYNDHMYHLRAALPVLPVLAIISAFLGFLSTLRG